MKITTTLTRMSIDINLTFISSPFHLVGKRPFKLKTGRSYWPPWPATNPLEGGPVSAGVPAIWAR
jgi:hypothetical protein